MRRPLPDLADVAPARFAALVAPIVDRVFAYGMVACRVGGGAEVSARYGGPANAGYLIEFRTRLADPVGAVEPLGFAAVGRYRDPATQAEMLDQHVTAGMLRRSAEGSFAATERGRAYLAEISTVMDHVLPEMWQDHSDGVDRLLAPVGRLLAAGLSTGGRAFATMAPPYEPAGTTPGTRLLNRLGTLRYHRADAHAMAWRMAGHTAESIQALTNGPERTAIEAETNRLAAAPFAVLTPDERLLLLADLGALPGPLPG